MKDYDVVVIGGGPAGMGAAIESSKTGAKTLIVERDDRLGGILNQCIHNGFGLHYFKEELTGPEYAYKFEKLVNEHDIDVLTNTFVTNIDGKKLKLISDKGCDILNPKAIVLAMGCREKTAGNVRLSGTRPAGVMTAGQVQKLVNFYGKLPGKKVVILGSGDIGLIMARRLTMQGAKVEMVLEVMPNSSGLPRNMRQCLEDFNIPIYFRTNVIEVVGDNRIIGIKYAQVDDNFNPIKGTEKFIECDLLVLSVGLTPENDIIKNVKINNKTNGFVVNEYRECSEGIFACGNVLHVHDLVDNVTVESMMAGKNAGLYAKGLLQRGKESNILCGDGVRYTVPSTFYLNDGYLDVYFRVSRKFINCNIIARCNGAEVYKKFELGLNPSVMVTVSIDKTKIDGDIEISIEENV
jgi:NADPH-dependent 2,4-dienoyl-CoA reductase/sulfur reductase-like enzyme